MKYHSSFRAPIYLVAFFLFFISCDRDEGPNGSDIELPENKIENEAYAPHARQKMNVYLPKGRTEETPVVLLIHGGFWVDGDKNDFVLIQQQLLNMKIASVNINYRYVSPTHDYRGLMEDLSLALSHVKAKASDWGIRGGDYHLIGFSAGGHMALLYGYTVKKPGEVASVISVAGPVGLTADLLSNPVVAGLALDPLEWLTGAPLPISETDPNFVKYMAVSPISYVEQAVPTLLLHGTADEIVPFSQSQNLKDALDNQQIRNKLVPLQDATHDISASPLDLVKALLETSNWVKN